MVVNPGVTLRNPKTRFLSMVQQIFVFYSYLIGALGSPSVTATMSFGSDSDLDPGNLLATALVSLALK